MLMYQSLLLIWSKRMILQILASTWFWIFFMLITMSIMAILMAYYKNDLQKCFIDLQIALEQENNNINKNFEQIHGNLNVLEREIDHASHVTKVNVYKPLGKKSSKFLTPKGKLKKKYLNDPLAQKCYQKFHNVQAA